MSCDYQWPQMWKYVKEFVGSCDICAHANNLHHRPYGLLQLLPTLPLPWSFISMNFITYLPPFTSFDSILVVLDCLMKVVHFIPYNKTITSEKTTKLFLDHVFWYHGIFKNIIYNHGPQSTSKFWRQLFGHQVSSNFHPQMNGQMEWVN